MRTLRVSIPSKPICSSATKVDVLVIGRSPQGGTLGRLQDLSYAMVRDARCPVLSV